MRVPVVALLLLFGACGSESSVLVEGEPVPTPYDGPLVVETRDPDDPDVLGRSGAAGLALECAHPPANGGGGDYDSGLESVQDGPGEALDDWLDEEGWFGLPDSGYRLEREDGDRVLLSFDVDGRTKVAVIVRDGLRDWDDEVGWGVETWAQCDAAELPEEWDGDLQVWTDASGARVPTVLIHSRPGPEHCDWQEITFLHVGDATSGTQYLGGPAGDLADLLRTTYDAHAALPDDATDTGYRRDGRELWLTDDAAWLVRPGATDDAERWPAAREPIHCA